MNDELRLKQIMSADGGGGDGGIGGEFDWSPMGESWWREAGRLAKATEKQMRFACARFRGCTKMAAAREAGYAGTAETIKPRFPRWLPN